MSEENNRIYDKLDKLDDKFDRKLDKLDYRTDNIEKQLIVYNEELSRHIEGVQQARKENKMLKEYIDLETKKITEKIEPISIHVTSMESYMKAMKSISYAILKIAGIGIALFGVYAKITGKF